MADHTVFIVPEEERVIRFRPDDAGDFGDEVREQFTERFAAAVVAFINAQRVESDGGLFQLLKELIVRHVREDAECDAAVFEWSEQFGGLTVVLSAEESELEAGKFCGFTKRADDELRFVGVSCRIGTCPGDDGASASAWHTASASWEGCAGPDDLDVLIVLPAPAGDEPAAGDDSVAVATAFGDGWLAVRIEKVGIINIEHAGSGVVVFRPVECVSGLLQEDDGRFFELNDSQTLVEVELRRQDGDSPVERLKLTGDVPCSEQACTGAAFAWADDNTFVARRLSPAVDIDQPFT